jgi:AAA15 family ATPase/GTPase
MLSSIHIQGFKGFKDTKIEPLRRVNLIVGGQNSGKTSFLEAIEAGVQLDTGSYRAYQPEQIHNYITSFLQQSILRKNVASRQANSIANSNLCSIETKYLEIKENYRIKPSVFSVYPTEEHFLVKLYDIAVKSKTKNKLTNLLKQIEPRLEAIESVAADGEGNPSLHTDIGLKKLIPISMLGQGFNRLAYLYSGLLGQGADCALIDELENGIHYSALPTVWQGIANIARELDIQLFITTHSYECIQAATKVFEATPEEFQIIRLERTEDNNIRTVSISDEKLKTALSSNWEIR